MSQLADVGLVFVAGLCTALATGLGALPFFLVDEIGDRWSVILWGLASGIMVTASVFGLLQEGLAEANGSYSSIAAGVVVGVVLVVVAHEVLMDAELDPKEYAEADYKKLLLILGILTVHSFPEGVAIGVSFADLAYNVENAIPLLGFSIPVLAVVMTIAISVHNVPEGTAIAIPLQALDVGKWKMVWWAVFSSLPQPIGAVIAFYFVSLAREFLPFGYGFAAGAMIYLVLTEFIPEALETGESLPSGGRTELVSGIAAGVVMMVPLALI